MKKIIYPACFYKEENGQYSVIFPNFVGATFGNNLDDAYQMAADFLGGAVAELEESREIVPLASEITEVVANEYPDGFVSLVSADVDKYRNNKAVKKTLTIPAWLNDEATAQKINFSQVLQEALKEILT